MVELLAFMGLLLIGYALWRDKNKEEKQKEDLLEYKKLHEDLIKAQKDVKSLLKHMEEASESIVEDIALRLEEMKNMEKMLQEKAFQEKHLPNEIIPEHGEKVTAQKAETGNTDQTRNTIEFPAIKREVSDSPIKVKRTPNRQKKQTVREEKVREPKIKEVPVTFEATPKQQMVYAMSNLGYSEEEIAKNMNIGKGEVRLILELKRKGEKHNA